MSTISNSNHGNSDNASPAAAPNPSDVKSPDGAPSRLPFPVVGIGASAGGLDAIIEFLKALRPDTGMAFVFIQHLPPEHESMIADILANHTTMVVAQVDDGTPVQPNHFYVIRPGHTLTIKAGLLHLGPRLEKPGHNHPVDDFFKSLADEQRTRAICVILSGTGSNGTSGAQTIKEVGGLCIAQDPETAKFPAMPRHLVDTGYADYILRPQDIPDILINYASHLQVMSKESSQAKLNRDEQHLNEIFATLRARTKQDFSGYKKPTVFRRIGRRMGLNRLTDLGDYAKLLRQNPTEVTALAEDLLIHVTGFFRDPEAWETLRTQVIVPLVATRDPGTSIRCWVTACSSGEEAYSLAMLLMEEAQRVNKLLDIKVFATDMAERSLQNARNGVFPGGIEGEIAPDLLEKYFNKDEAVFRVRPELRERVVFAPQNVLQDPPFNRLDIVTCRNLLIYLEPDVQRRVLSMLHFGLREAGTLFLGTSETIAGAEDLFEPMDKKARLFRRIGPTRHGLAPFPLPSTASGLHTAMERIKGTGPGATIPSLAQLTTRTLAALHIPPAVTIDNYHRIVYFHGNTDLFLNQPRGEATRDLLLLARESLRGTIRAALQNARTQKTAKTVQEGWIETQPGHRTKIAVTVMMLDAKSAPDHWVVSFEDKGQAAVVIQNLADATDDILHKGALQEELHRTRQELQATIEELQTSNEEMKASHEEVISMNEELQSTNEELETSKEELQSLNEELTTVNAQLQVKMDELQATSNDLSSLLTSTEIAVLFLDTRLRIRRYTAPVKELLDLIPSDVGRPLNDLARKFTDPLLTTDSQQVLDGLTAIEREVPALGNRWFMRKILPYRTLENQIEGVVVLFVETTARKLAEEEIKTGREQLSEELKAMEHLHEVTTRLFTISDLQTGLSEVLNATIDSFGADMGKIQLYNPETSSFEIMAHRGFPPAFFDAYRRIKEDTLRSYHSTLRQGNRIIIEDVISDPSYNSYKEAATIAGYRSVMSTPLLSRNGDMLGFISTHFTKPYRPTARQLHVSDIFARHASALIERLNTDDAMRQSNARFRMAADVVPDLLWENNPAGQASWFNRRWLEYTGRKPRQLAGHGWLETVHSLDRESTRTAFQTAISQGTPFRHEYRLRGMDGLYRWYLAQALPFKDVSGKILQWFGAATDIHEDKMALNALRESDLRHRLSVNDIEDYAIFMLDSQGMIATWNPGAQRVLGYTETEIIGKHVSIIYVPEERQATGSTRKMETALNTGRAADERWYVRKDGTRFWGSGVLTVLRDDSGNLRGFSKVMHDTTESQMAEEAQRRLAAVVQSSNDAIISFNLDGTILSWNPAAQAMFGYRLDEALTMNLRQLCPADNGKRYDDFISDLAANRPIVQLETRWTAKNGSPLDVSISASLTRDYANEALVGAVIQDITARKQVESAVNDARQAAEEASRTKDEFLAMLSHELRTPLAAILLWVKLLQRKTDLSPQSQEGLSAIQTSAEAQKSLIDDLLDTSRITAGTLRLQMRRTHIVNLVKSAIESVLPAATAKGITIQTDFPDEIGAILADSDRLRQVIWNVLSNAVKFTGSGGTVSVALTLTGRTIDIKVKDTGIGIPADFLPHVFSPFRQADATRSRRNGGLGLGLAIARQLMELHGGSISARSAGESMGSEFTIQIPAVSPHDEKIHAPKDTAKDHNSLAGLSIFLVEDDSSMRVALTRLLRDHHITVTAVDSALNALAALDGATPDIIITDLAMPEMDGFALYKKIREWEAKTNTAPIPIIALTAFARPEDRQAVLNAGFRNYLAKPLDPEHLLKVLREVRQELK